MKKTLLSATLALSLCAWLGADTKEGGGTTDPTDPPATSSAKQMLTIDGEKTTIYPGLKDYSPEKVKGFIEALGDLHEKTATLDEVNAKLEELGIQIEILDAQEAQ